MLPRPKTLGNFYSTLRVRTTQKSHATGLVGHRSGYTNNSSEIDASRVTYNATTNGTILGNTKKKREKKRRGKQRQVLQSRTSWGRGYTRSTKQCCINYRVLVRTP